MSRATACFSMYFAHVEARELVAELNRQLLGELGLADAGRPGEQKAAGRTIGLTQPGARALDRLRHRDARRRAGRTPRAASDSSSVRSRSRSDDDACRAGIRAMRATIRSMSAASTITGAGQWAGWQVGRDRRDRQEPQAAGRRGARPSRPRRADRSRCRAAGNRAGDAPRA